jgi:GTP-binding protein HflX
MMDPSKALVLYSCKKRDRIAQARLLEDIELARALGLKVEESHLIKLRDRPHPATYIGKGWVETVRLILVRESIDIVVMDPDLSPIQQRALERIWKCTLWDRTALILMIFAQRAQTASGKLQVQLARLMYQKSRLVHAWSHLERQRGGFGFLGGPGESQLELDRRILDDQIIKIRKALEKVRKTRQLHRKNRKTFPLVALVGYTNAGKSTLFHALTGKNVFRANMPFATLDPTLMKVRLPLGHEIILLDTVGFISHLPEMLRLAFQATLEEIMEADLLLHVRDGSSPETLREKQDVHDVLSAMKCDLPHIEVLNKVDCLTQEELLARHLEAPDLVAISALYQTGLSNLLQSIEERIWPVLSVHSIEALTHSDT